MLTKISREREKNYLLVRTQEYQVNVGSYQKQKHKKFNTISDLDCMAFYPINYFTFLKKLNFHNFLCNFSLHEIAADLSIQATSKFLNDIRSTVGDDIFAKFLNLKSERSLALVIDVSGSMSGEPISSLISL